MECTICSTVPLILRPPRNTICAGCYEAARTAISLIHKFESATVDKGSLAAISSKPQPLAKLPKWITNMEETHEKLSQKIDFLSNFVHLFRSQLLADIHLQPGNGGTPIPAHRALLAARSEIFKTMLDPDTFKQQSSSNDTMTIMLPELSHDELATLLEFLYTGDLSAEKLDRHVYALTLAADKYEVPYLLSLCQRHMVESLESRNALAVLEISESVCGGGGGGELKERAVRCVVENMEEVAFSREYEGFVASNPHLAVQVTRAFLADARSAKDIIDDQTKKQ